MTVTVENEETDREHCNAALIAALRTTNADETESSWELDVINDAERGRWIAALGAEAIGELTYRFVGGRVVLLSVWVAHPYRNRRVATELIHRVLDEVRETGRKITIICPVVGEFVAHHPEYLDLIDTVHPGSGAYPDRNAAVGSDHDARITALERDLA